MFNRTYELTANQDYQERIRQTAQENFAARVERANRLQSALPYRLLQSLAHLAIHLQRRPHIHMNDAVITR